MAKTGVQKYALLIIPLLFLLYSAPGALDYVFHYPDEKYYTDAVQQMMDKGDLFTPYKADGTPRFKKPVITYWVLMASYKMFGVSRFSSRLFFWLAGALLVLVTFLMAKSLTKDRNIAVIAAFITASNPLVLISASRSIPDILLVLFLTVSAWGFLEILLAVNPHKKYYWMAYLGAALAFETKGIPAVGFAGISILFLLLNPWKKKKIKDLIEPVSLVVAICVALSWFVIMYAEHGTTYLSSFFADQVGERVSSKIMQVVTNTFLGIGNLILFFIPWVIIVSSKPKRLKTFITSQSLQTKAIFGFIISWVILFVIMSGAVFKFYDRYVLPVVPLLSILFAYLLTQSAIRFKNGFFRLFLMLNLVVVAINIWYAIFILPDPVLVAGTLFSIGLITAWFFNAFRRISKEICIANAIMFLYFNTFILLYPLLMPNPGKQLVTHLHRQGITVTNKVYVYGNIRTASNIRIHSNNHLQVVSMDTVYTMPPDRESFLVFSKKEKPFLHLEGYHVTEGSEEWSRVPVEKFPEFLQQPVKKLKESGTKYYIAKPLPK